VPPLTVASLATMTHSTSADATDAGDDARSGRLVVVHLIGGQRREFEKGTAPIEQGVDAVSWQEFAPLDVSLARRLGTARVVIPIGP